MALGLLERQARHRPAEAALISAVADLLGGVSAPAPPPGEPAWPGEPLTESETRVLRYLPIDMGVPEIAAELYLSANAVKTHLRHLYATSARTAATRPCSAPGPSACSQGPPAGPRTPVGPAWGAEAAPSKAVTASPGSGSAEDLANKNRRKVSSHDDCSSPGRSGSLEVCPESGPPSRVMGHSSWPCPEDRAAGRHPVQLRAGRRYGR